MNGHDTPHQPVMEQRLRRWSILALVLTICLVVGSWIFVSHMVHRPSTVPGKTNEMNKQIPQGLYIGYKDVVYRLSAHDGNIIWQQHLTQPYKPYRLIGSSMSIKTISNSLICAILEHAVFILRTSDGKELWHYAVALTPAQQAENRASIMGVVFDQKLLYISFSRGGVAALDLQTGEQKWKKPITGGDNIAVANGNLYAEIPNSKGYPALYAFDGATGQERWHFERELWGNSSFSPVLVDNGILYYGGNPLYALNAQTGKKVWEQRMPQRERSFAGLRLKDNILYSNTNAIIPAVGGLKIPPKSTVSLPSTRRLGQFSGTLSQGMS
ncbi:PQQ-binding-like beta-propeller repeat protein [Ktedonospora formicarum]|uniref:Pyrrolo-quinoline quinone repeat domain-containing protein n=1 Tax=Ktedonospora formicarum TaxID=2778364 RepID=A0A8J3HYI2_9CHLR|nr:PQQ-binding-like beta-propeller repeat protein [Ktedonospora formicarum]GHO46079.1 hypothetical protein KSX_42420 [Ktedonospora formicarum]